MIYLKWTANMHSPNEKFKIENYYLGIMTIAHFFERSGQ